MRSTALRTTTFTAALALAFPTAALAGSGPLVFNHEGLLLDAQGFPVNGPKRLTVRVCDAREAGLCAYAEEHEEDIVSGYYALLVGSVEPLDLDMFEGDDVWLEIQVDDDPPMRPRHPMVSAPFAIRATVADNVDGDATPRSLTTPDLRATNANFTNNVTIAGTLAANGNVTVAGNLAANGTVRANLFEGGLSIDMVKTPSIQNNAVTETKIAGGAVSNRTLGDGVVDTRTLRNQSVSIPKLGQDVLDALAGRGGGGGGIALTINSDTLDHLDSAQFVRSDISDNLQGDSYEFSGEIRASTGGDGKGVLFQGQTSDGSLRYLSGGGSSALTLMNDGGAGDGITLSTRGGVIRFEGGDVDALGNARIRGDIRSDRHGDIAGNLAVGGAASVGSALSVGGPAIPGQRASVHGNITVTGEGALLGSLGIGADLNVGRNVNATGVATAGLLVGNNGIVAVNGNIEAQGRNGGGDVVAGRDVTAGRDLIVAGAYRAQGLIEPSLGRGARGLVWPAQPSDPSDRAWLQFVDDAGAVSALEIGVGDDPNDTLRLLSSGNITLVAPASRVTGTLTVDRNATFNRDVSVNGNVEAVEISADILTINDEVNVAALLTADEIQANTIVVDPDGDRNPNTVGQGVGTFYADQIAGRLAAGTVDSNALAAGAVTTTKLGANSINSSHIIDGQVQNPDLANNAVQSNNIADGSIAAVDLGPNSVVASKVADDQLEDRHFRRNSVGDGVLADGSVRSPEILDFSIQNVDLRDGSVDGRVLADNTITGADVQDGSLTGVDIQNGSIHGDKLQVNTVTGGPIQDRSLGSAEFADGAVDARVLGPNSVFSSHIAPGNVQQSDLGDNVVNSAKVIDGSLTGADIGNETLTGANVANGSLNGNDIQDRGIFAGDLALDVINNTNLIAAGSIDKSDLNFDPGVGGGAALDGDITFPLDNQGAIWKLGAGGPDMFYLRREGGDLALRGPAPLGFSRQLVVRPQIAVQAAYGFNADGAGSHGNAYMLRDTPVLQNDRDLFARRLFVTGHSNGSLDTDEAGTANEYAVAFPRHSGGSRPQITSNPGARLLSIVSGYNGADRLNLDARGGTTVDGPFDVVGRLRHEISKGDGSRRPLISVSDYDNWNRGYNAGYDPIVFTTYLDGMPGAHTNRNTETILIGNQPEWQSDYIIFVYSDFDSNHGDRNHIAGPGAGTWEWWDYGGNGSRSHSWSISESGTTAGNGTDPDGFNDRSRYNMGHAWAIGGWRGRRCRWWRCWWNWYDNDANTWVRFRWYWDANGYPSNAILARGQFWYKRVAYTQSNWSGRNSSEFDIWFWGQRGNRRINHNWGCCGTHDTGWVKAELTPEHLYNWRINEIRFENRNWAGSWWNGGDRGTTQTEFWLDSFAIEILTAQLSELQVYADATFWGSLHVKQDLKVDGRKFFIQQHPTDPNREIAYIAVEGGEAGTYWRGSARLERGEVRIPLPEHFSLVTADEGLTATATLRQAGPAVYVSELTNQEMVVKTADGSRADLTFDFVVMGVRKGFENHVPLRYRDKRADQGGQPMAGGPGGPGGGGAMGMMPPMMGGGGAPGVTNAGFMPAP